MIVEIEGSYSLTKFSRLCKRKPHLFR